MRSRFLIAAAFVVLSAGTAAAETYTCRSLDETDFPVTARFDLRYSSGAYAIMRAEFQIEGDIGYSTAATHPLDLATVTGVEVDEGSIQFSLQHTDPDYDGIVATLHVVTLSEGAHELTAGVLKVVGGGLWPIACRTGAGD
jgi:hypothetical protein